MTNSTIIAASFISIFTLSQTANAFDTFPRISEHQTPRYTSLRWEPVMPQALFRLFAQRDPRPKPAKSKLRILRRHARITSDKKDFAANPFFDNMRTLHLRQRFLQCPEREKPVEFEESISSFEGEGSLNQKGVADSESTKTGKKGFYLNPLFANARTLRLKQAFQQIQPFEQEECNSSTDDEVIYNTTVVREECDKDGTELLRQLREADLSVSNNAPRIKEILSWFSEG